MFPDANQKQILAFVRTGKAKKAAIPGEGDGREQTMLDKIIDLDPFKDIDKLNVKQLLKDEDEVEKFDFEKDGANLVE